jgi:hypothetical protein
MHGSGLSRTGRLCRSFWSPIDVVQVQTALLRNRIWYVEIWDVCSYIRIGNA